jgi:hypothetical protein
MDGLWDKFLSHYYECQEQITRTDLGVLESVVVCGVVVYSVVVSGVVVYSVVVHWVDPAMSKSANNCQIANRFR